MKLLVKEDSKNYACSVIEIKNLYPIEGADAVVRTVVNGNDIVVPKTTEIGSKMLYFISGTKLSAEYCYKNNLYDRTEENYDKTKRAFISFKQRRIKAIKLRGIISNGMLMPLESLVPFLEGYSIRSLKVGDEFTDINGNNLCEKYIVPIKNNGINGEKTPKKNKLKD